MGEIHRWWNVVPDRAEITTNDFGNGKTINYALYMSWEDPPDARPKAS